MRRLASMTSEVKKIYTRLVHPEAAEQAITKQFEKSSNELRNLFSDKKNIRILDLGCGDAWLLRLLAPFFSENGRKIEITCIDRDINALKFAETNLASVAGTKEYIKKEYIKIEFDAFCKKHLQTENYDLCIASFFFHHSDDLFESINRLIGLLNSHGVVLLMELKGYHAAWCNSFDKVGNIFEYSEEQLKNLQQVRITHEESRFQPRMVTAANSQLIIDYLSALGFQKCHTLDVDFNINTNWKVWDKAINYINDENEYESIFSVFASIQEKDRKRILQNLDKRKDSTMKNRFSVQILKKQQHSVNTRDVVQKLAMRDAKSKMLRDFQDTMVAVDTSPEDQLKKDALFLVDSGIIKKPALIFPIRWNMSTEKWDRTLQPLTRMDEISEEKYRPVGRQQYQAYKKIRQVLKDEIEAEYSSIKINTLTEFIYGESSTKPLFRFVIKDSDPPPNFTVNLSSWGIINEVTVVIPDDLKLIIDKTLSKDSLEPPFNYLIDGEYGFFESGSISSDGNDIAPKVASDLLKKQSFKKLISDIMRVYEVIDQYNDGIRDPMGISEAEAAFIASVCVAIASIGLKQVIHLPSRSGVSLGGKQKSEISAGGLIIYCDESTQTDDRLLREFVELRFASDALSQSAKELKKNLTKNAEASIMARNLSHNIGSHALSSPTLIENIGELDKKDDHGDFSYPEARNNLIEMNAYLQGRLDFISRVLEGGRAVGQPMFLLRSVINGFTRQRAILGTMFADSLYGREKISFRIESPENTVVLKVGEQTSGGELKGDLLVSVPGGVIGCHAMYALLENIMRNSVKYGRKARETGSSEFHVNINLIPNDNKNYYIVEISDNLSTGQAQENEEYESTVFKDVMKIRKLLKQDLIDERIRKSLKGHGLQEMKVCARELAGETSFASDDNATESSYACFVHKFRNRLKETDEQGETAWIKDKNSHLRCYWESEQGIIYQMLLQKPTLLGIVCSGDTEEGPCKPLLGISAPGNYYIKKLSGISELSSCDVHIGLICDRGQMNITTILGEIEKNDDALPFRLLVVIWNPERKQELENKRKEWKNNRKQEWKNTLKDYSQNLSPNRVRVVVDDKNFFVSLCESNAEHGKKWQDIVLVAYELWLSAYKERPKIDAAQSLCTEENREGAKWKLVIGFDRDATNEGGLVKKWQNSLASFESDLIDVFVYFQRDPKITSKGQTVDNAPQKEDDVNEACIIFDNHGKGAIEGEGVPFKARAYQEMKGNEHAVLYSWLEHPPCEPFEFSWFILTLVESMLTDIAVLDERIVHAVGTDIHDNKILKKLINARIIPLFSLCSENSSRFFLSTPVKNEFKDKGYDSVDLDTSSISLQASTALSTPEYNAAKGEFKENPIKPDLLIVHEGVLEMAKKKAGFEIESLDNLKKIGPRIVIMSGRGGTQSRTASLKKLPFVESSVLSTNVINGLNKTMLSQTLLSATK